MAMSAAQVSAELQRKKNLGLAPTNSGNMGQYNKLSPIKPLSAGQATGSALQPKPLGGMPAMSGAGAAVQLAPTSTTPVPAATAAPTSAPATPAPFMYNPETDPAYQARKRQIEAGVQTGTNNALVSLGSRGIGNSSSAVTAAMQQQQRGQMELQDTVIPQLEQQAYQHYSDDLARKYQGEQLEIQKGQLTGTYIPPEMKTQYDTVLQAKQEYANAATPEARAAARQRADAARAQIISMGGNPDLVGSNVTLEGARGNSGKFGIQTLEGQRTAYDMSADNPANQAQIISNKIDNLKLQNLPEHLKLELEQLKQQVSSGKIDLKTAEHNLDELTNPKSVTNKTKQLQLEMTQIDANNYSQEAKLKLQQLQKTVDQIGKEPALTDNEKSMQDIELEKARIELQNLKSGTPNKAVTAEDMRTYFDSMVQRDQDTNEITNPTDVESAILNSDLSDYDVYQMYLRYGLEWKGDIPTPGK